LFDFRTIYLDKITEWKRLDGGDFTIVSSSFEEVGYLWCLWLTFEAHLFSAGSCSLLCNLVAGLTGDDFLLTLGRTNMLDADMNALLNDTSIDWLVDTDSDGTLGYVEDNSSTSMVVLVGHTLVDGRVGEDVDVITNLDRKQVLSKARKSAFAELLGEHMTRTRANSE